MEYGDGKKLIVIVDDDKAITELISDLLESETDYQTMAVHDGRSALDLIRAVPASLILLDVRMPGLNGLQLYDILQANDATCEIPVIFVTANSYNAVFRSHNFQNYIAKPFSTVELLSLVAEALAD